MTDPSSACWVCVSAERGNVIHTYGIAPQVLPNFVWNSLGCTHRMVGGYADVGQEARDTKQMLLDMALEAEKAADNVANTDTKKEWLRKALVYRDLLAKLPASNGGHSPKA